MEMAMNTMDKEISKLFVEETVENFDDLVVTNITSQSRMSRSQHYPFTFLFTIPTINN